MHSSAALHCTSLQRSCYGTGGGEVLEEPAENCVLVELILVVTCHLSWVCAVCVQTEQPMGRQSVSGHGTSDIGGLQHIPENPFPPYATISKGTCHFCWFVGTGWCRKTAPLPTVIQIVVKNVPPGNLVTHLYVWTGEVGLKLQRLL